MEEQQYKLLDGKAVEVELILGNFLLQAFGLYDSGRRQGSEGCGY